MGLREKKGMVTPHEWNPSPRPRRGPKRGERKMKKEKKKIDMEDLKKEVVMVSTPKWMLTYCPLKALLNPQPFNILPTGQSHPSFPTCFFPSPRNDQDHHLSFKDSAVPSERSQINFGTAEHQVLCGPGKGE